MSETSLTVYITGALAVHVAPLIALPEPDGVPVEADITFCGGDVHCCDEVPPEETEPLTREQAIELARTGSLLGPGTRFEPLTVARALSSDDEIYLDVTEGCCYFEEPRWRVAQAPLLPPTRGLKIPTTIAIQRPQVAGQLEAGTIRRALDRHRRELASCAPPDSDLDIPVEFLIRPDGTATVARTGVPGGRCLERVVEGIVFPARSGPTQVHAPIEIRSESLAYGVVPVW